VGIKTKQGVVVFINIGDFGFEENGVNFGKKTLLRRSLGHYLWQHHDECLHWDFWKGKEGTILGESEMGVIIGLEI
jgi:hypothetical protein